jgi:hypothetical protein
MLAHFAALGKVNPNTEETSGSGFLGKVPPHTNLTLY